MVSTLSDATLITNLNVASAQLNRYLSIVIFIFGIIGNLLNCPALSQRTLCSNPCASLFLASSIANLVTLISGVAVRLLAGWSADLTETIEWLCKFRIFILFISRTIASWLITSATIDRWLSSSTNAHRRERSTLKNAQRSTILLIFVSILIYVQIFYCYKANLINTPTPCYGRTAWCRILVDLEFACISILMPSLLMFIFGSMTVLNIRQTTLRRIQPTVVAITSQTTNKNRSLQQRKKTDHHLLYYAFNTSYFINFIFTSTSYSKSLFKYDIK